MGAEPGGFTLRAATPDDVDVLVAFRVTLFEELGELRDSASERSFRQLTRESFSIGLVTGSCLAWLALASRTEPIASAVMHLFPKLPSPANPVLLEGYLLNIYTIPSWRRRGVATALVTAALEAARARGLRRIRLHTTDQGRRVYEQAGFVPRLNEMELML